jgi:deazaflavin-dependent oxidoreductase (nitroreductase family)
MAGEQGPRSVADFNRAIIEEFRANGGKVGGPFEGGTLALLTTTGARTGRVHTTPVACMPDGERVLVFATNAGGPSNPAWYANLLADNRVTVEIGAQDGVESYEATAIVLHGEERAAKYAEQAERAPGFAEYEKMTDREIPVIALYRAAAGQPLGIGDVLLNAHRILRDDLASLRAEVDAYLTGGQAAGQDRPGLAAQLQAHCVAFCGALGQHHEGEENQGFPPLERLHPELKPVLERLRREHVAVSAMRADLQALLDDIDSADPSQVRAELDRVNAELEAHYAYEERELLTKLNAITAADWGGSRPST